MNMAIMDGGNKESSKEIREEKFNNKVFLFIGFILFPLIIIISIISVVLISRPSNKGSVDVPPICYPIAADQKQADLATKLKQLAQNPPSAGAETSSISTVKEGYSDSGYTKKEETKQKIITTGQWTATDYSPGDITTNQYTVQLGDTLWEIAEAHYGSGFEWTKILNANSGSIGFLPDGEQALIVEGQVLVLP